MEFILEYLKSNDSRTVLSCESGASYHRLCSYTNRPVVVLKKQDNQFKGRHLYVHAVQELNLSHCERVSDSLWIASAERSIIDMLKYGVEERFLFESLDSLLQKNGGDFSYLLDVAKDLDGLEIQDFIDDLPDWMEENWDWA